MKIYWQFLCLFLCLSNHRVVAQQELSRTFTYIFVITELPENTPHDAQLFLSGNFTKWNSAHPDYQFHHLPDGSYKLTIQTDLPRLEYKVTRGNWGSVEGRESGKARTNRILFRDGQKSSQEVDIAILSWEDLSGTFHFYSLYDLLMLFSAFQGILLLLLIPGRQHPNRMANRWLFILLGLTSLLLFVRTVASFRDVAQVYTKLLLLPDLVLFLYAPAFYTYLRRLLFSTSSSPSGWWHHFVPVLVQVGIYMPYLLMDNKLLQLKIVNRDPWLSGLFLGAGLLGLFYNAGYWLLCRRMVRGYQKQHPLNLSAQLQVRYLNTVLAIQAVCLSLWLFFFGLLAVGSLATTTESVSVAEKNVDLIWFTFASILFVLSYYAIRWPELFKLPEPGRLLVLEATGKAIDEPPKKQQIAVLATQPEPPQRLTPAPESTESVSALKQQIDVYMKRQKPYTNPNITLAELALRLHMPPHVLSKTINEAYGQNFFDFINHYRIEELKSRLDDPKFRSFTVLSMAYEVGFNSKTAFNRSFRKLMNQTPSEYISARLGRREVV